MFLPALEGGKLSQHNLRIEKTITTILFILILQMANSFPSCMACFYFLMYRGGGPERPFCCG